MNMRFRIIDRLPCPFTFREETEIWAVTPLESQAREVLHGSGIQKKNDQNIDGGTCRGRTLSGRMEV